MKAVQITSDGIIIKDIDRPSPEPGQVIVKVAAACLNPVDLVIRDKYMDLTLGVDFSGTIAEVGPEVELLKEGDEVYGNSGPFRGGTGTFAEFVAVPANNLAKKPNSVNMMMAAAYPLVGTSAIQAIDEIIDIKENQKILIRGGAGAIGSIAIQLAKNRKAYVATSVAQDDIEYVKTLGADEIYNYREKDVSEILKDYDAVLETARSGTDDLMPILKKGGKLVSLTDVDESLAKEHEIEVVAMMTKTSKEQLDKLTKLIDGRKVQLRVAKETFTLEDVQKALEFFENGKPEGKVIITI